MGRTKRNVWKYLKIALMTKRELIDELNKFLKRKYEFYVCGYLGVDEKDIRRGGQKYVTLMDINKEENVYDWYWEEFNLSALKKFTKELKGWDQEGYSNLLDLINKFIKKKIKNQK